MKCHANRILHDGFARDNRIASRDVAKSNRNQLFTKISESSSARSKSNSRRLSLLPEARMIL